MADFKWSEFQKRMKDADPDFRIIALSDAQTYLTTQSSLKDEPQCILMEALVRTFGPKEPNNEVHSTAVGLLSYVYRLLSPNNRKTLVTLMGRYMNPADPDFTDVDIEYYRKASMRENAAMGLRQIAPCFDTTNDIPVINELVAALTSTLAIVSHKEERSDVYDILSKCLPLTHLEEAVGNPIYDRLYTQIRKDLEVVGDEFVFSKTCQTLCSLAPLFSAEQFSRLVTDLTSDLGASGPKLRRSIDVLTALSKSVADRLAPSMPALFDLLFREIKRLDGLDTEDRESDASDEVRAGALEAIANLLGDASPTEDILTKSLKEAATLASWDPNFCEDAEVEVEVEEGGFTGFDDDDEDGFDMGYDDEGYMDDANAADDGCSWKVRRAASKVLLASVLSRRDLLQGAVLPVISGSDSKSLLVTALKDRSQDNTPFSLNLVATVLQLCGSQSLGAPAASRSTATLTAVAPLIIAQLCAIITKGTHARPALECLRSTIRTLGVAGADATILAAVKSILDVPHGSGDAKTITAALEVTSVLASMNETFAVELLPIVANHAANFRFHVTKDAVSTLQASLSYITKADVATTILNGGVSALTAPGMDGDCRRVGAQLCAAVIASPFSQVVTPATLNSIMDALLASLNVDSSRVAAAAALRSIFTANPKLATSADAAKISACTSELSTHLRKQSVDERETSAFALAAIITAAPSSLTTEEKVLFDLKNSSSLLSKDDLRMTICAFNLIAALASQPKIAATIVTDVVPHSLDILQTAVYTTALHEAVTISFSMLARNAPSYDGLVGVINAAFSTIKAETTGRTNMVAVALGAALGVDADAKRRSKAVQGLVAKVAVAESGPQAAVALGEIGRHIDIAADAPEVVAALLKETQVVDTVKIAATRALGFACTRPKTFEAILGHLSNAKTTPALSGVALRAVNASLTLARTAPSVERVSAAVLAQASAHPEVAGECLGRLAVWDLQSVAASLQAGLSKSAPNAALIVMAAAKSIVSSENIHDTPANIEILSNIVVAAGNAYSSAADALPLRRHTINAMSSLLERRGGRFYTQAMNAVLLPCLINELVEDPNLVNVIDLNTFKQKEDRGADLRREAFVTLESLIVREGASFSDDSAGGVQCPLMSITQAQRADVIGRVINACAPRNEKTKKYTSPHPIEDVTEVNFVARRVLLLTARTSAWTEVLGKEFNNIGASLLQLGGADPAKPPIALPEAEKSRYPDNVADARKTLLELKEIFPRAASSTAAPQFVEAVRNASTEQAFAKK